MVIVPIIEPLKVILDEIGAKLEKDAYVFPQIFNGATDESLRRKLTVQENPIDIDSLSPEQMKEMLKKMMGQQ